MSQHNFQKGDHVKLKHGNSDLSIGIVADVYLFEWSPLFPPHIAVVFGDRVEGLFADELILVSEDEPDC